MGLTDAVAAFIAATDAMREQRSEANAEAFASALDAILLRDEPAATAGEEAQKPEGEGGE